MKLEATHEGLDAYCARLRAAGLDAPWSRPGVLIAQKKTRVEPCHWRWAEIEPLLRRSAEFVTPGRGAERRILRLANPGVPELTSAHTLSLAVQYLLPGETAPAHRHTPNAIRFMLQGRGASTIVEGEKCAMAPGDLVLTPSMTLHKHGNEGTEPVMWLDGLDSPIVRYLEILAMEGPAKAVEGPAKAGHYPELPVGAGFSRPIPSRQIHYRWEPTYRALLERAKLEPNPFDDVLLEYLDPATRTSVLPTLGCYVQMIRPRVQTLTHRETSTAVYHVVRGSGWSTVAGVRYDWRRGDFFVVPPLAAHGHANDSAEPAILFSLQDVPLLRALGLYHETSNDRS